MTKNDTTKCFICSFMDMHNSVYAHILDLLTYILQR